MKNSLSCSSCALVCQNHLIYKMAFGTLCLPSNYVVELLSGIASSFMAVIELFLRLLFPNLRTLTVSLHILNNTALKLNGCMYCDAPAVWGSASEHLLESLLLCWKSSSLLTCLACDVGGPKSLALYESGAPGWSSRPLASWWPCHLYSRTVN